ncbi:MAG: hypothetical protein Ta2A_02140 [Treponemataceae bacterium]|nr:MAG: hypothetical protein Ta2A_02140 [Treponemataceae bacterium]
MRSALLIRAEGVHTPPLGAKKGYAHLSAIPREKQHTPLLAAGLLIYSAVRRSFTSTSSSLSAQAAMKKIVARFGDKIKIVNDNGPENMKDAEAYLASLNITQYWARPHTPKDKPFVERFIGTFQRECTAQTQPR